MNTSEIMGKLEEIFKDIFGDEIKLTSEMSSDDIEEWDSLAQMNIIFAIENEFEVEVDMSDMIKMRDVASIVNYIKEKR